MDNKSDIVSGVGLTLTPWSKVNPTTNLRFFVRSDGLKILQQQFVIESYSGKYVDYREEWRDVPAVTEAKQ